MKFVLVGKCFSTATGGPGAVMKALAGQLEGNPEARVLFWNEERGKLSFLWALLRQLLSSAPCVINVHTDGLLIPAVVLLASGVFRRHRYYMTLHGVYAIESTFTGNVRRDYLRLEKWLCSRFPNIICVSRQQKADIERLYGRKERVTVIPNGTDAVPRQEEPLCWEGRLELVNLGGLRKRKGLDESLGLVALLKARDMDVHLSVYGPEEGTRTREWLKERCHRLGLSEQVSFHGPERDKERIYSILEQSHAQLCLSGYDTFNVAIAESLALGCPCISSHRCGAAFLIEDGENGLVTDPTQPVSRERMYDFLRSLVRSPEKRERIRLRAEAYRRQLSWEGVCRQYLALAEDTKEWNT